MLEQLTLKSFWPSLAALAGIWIALWAAFWILKRAIRRVADRMQAADQEHREEIQRWARQLTRLLRLALGFAAALVAAFILLRGMGLGGLPQLSWEQVADWLGSHGLRVVLVAVGAYLVNRFVHMLFGRLPAVLARGEGPLAEVVEQRKRADTISRALRRIASSLVVACAGLIILRELGVDITPILTGAGILGLAVGFGAQNLVRDIISGFFLILENNVRVGDVAIINGKGGLVERIRLRTIVLRGLDGTVHVVPNGAINELSNLTKDFSYYVIDMGVAYKEDTDRVVEVMKEVAEELRTDRAFAPKILAPLEVLGVDDFADSAVVIKVRIKTVPLEQWNVGRELRRRIKKAFDAQGIEIPFPHISLYMGEASKPLAVQVAEKMGPA